MKLRLNRKNKFGARKTTIDGITFDSIAEAQHFQRLRLLQSAGEVVQIDLQPKFEIIPSYRHPETGRKIAATHYKADFRVTYKDGRVEIVDVKGHKTPVYALKKKLFECKYGIAIKEVS